MLLSGTADLLGIQAQVVGVGEHFLERQPRLVQAPSADKRLDVPGRARREGAFRCPPRPGWPVRVLLVPDVLIAVAIIRFVRWYRRRSRQAPHP